MCHFFKSKEWKAALFIFILALAYRTAYLVDYTENPFFSYVPPAFDQYNFDQGAQNFAKGDWLARSSNNQYSPVYKYFLGTIYFLFERDFRFVYFIQFIIGSLSASLVFLIGNRLFSYSIGLCSAIAYSLYGPNLFYEGILLREFLVPFFSLISIYALLRLKESPSTQTALLCGLFLSLLMQNRPNVIFIFPLLYFYLKDLPKSHNPAIKKLIIFFLLCSLPILIQCYQVHKRFVFYDDSGPITLLTGNVTDFHGSEWEITPKIVRFQQENKVSYANVLKEIANEAISYPVDFMNLYARKLYFFFHAHEFPSNLNYYMFQNFSSLLKTPWSYFSIFTSFGIAGMLWGLREFNKLKLPYLFFAGLSFMIFIYVPGRFRLPLVPIMMLFSFYALSCLWDNLKKKNYLKTFSFLCFSFLLLFLFNQRITPERIRAIDYVHLGEAYGERNQLDKALASYKMASKIDPYNQNAYQGIFAVFQIKGMDEKAILSLEEGYRMLPSVKVISYKLVQAYLKREQYMKAEKVCKEIIRREPGNLEIRNDLAFVLAKQNKQEEAVKELRKALKINPDSEAIKNNLGKLNY